MNARVCPAVMHTLGRQFCEDCGEKQAGFGLPEEGKSRWCFPCAQVRCIPLHLSDGRTFPLRFRHTALHLLCATAVFLCLVVYHENCQREEPPLCPFARRSTAARR
jgi:hypothetical protein